MKQRQDANSAISGRGVSAGGPSARRKTTGEPALTQEPFTDAIATRENGQGSQSVHLEVTYPAARRVDIAGSFNDWQAAQMVELGSGKWAVDLALQPGSYEYRLVVDGKWTADPNALHTVPNPFGEPNSLLIVPQGSREAK